jgi:hypothetical protein
LQESWLDSAAMTPRARKWLLALAFFCLVPVPFLLIETGFAPPLRVLFLASVFGAVAIVDGVQGPMAAFLLLLYVEAALFGVLSYLAAGVALRALAWLAPERFLWPLVVVTIGALLLLSWFEIYHTPHSSAEQYASLVGLFD